LQPAELFPEQDPREPTRDQRLSVGNDRGNPGRNVFASVEHTEEADARGGETDDDHTAPRRSSAHARTIEKVRDDQ